MLNRGIFIATGNKTTLLKIKFQFLLFRFIAIGFSSCYLPAFARILADFKNRL